MPVLGPNKLKWVPIRSFELKSGKTVIVGIVLSSKMQPSGV